MRCAWRTCDLHLLLTVTVLVSECLSTELKDPITPMTNQSSVQTTSKNNYTLASVTYSSVVRKNKPPTEDNTNLSVPVDTNVELFCPRIPCEHAWIVTWIIHSDELSCTRAYRTDTNETEKGNCTDERMKWVYRSNCSFVLQIDPVSLTHKGYYNCQIVTQEGNFQHGYHLQVLSVPLEVTLFQSEDGGAVCNAVSRKPAAQISWSPKGDCHTNYDQRDKDTVIVQSTCHWAESYVSNVSCAVSHETGNKTLSIELSQGRKLEVLTWIPCIILPIFALLSIGGSIWLWKSYTCSKCKLRKREDILVVGEDEMQPYASYTEKNNPLYDNFDRKRTP